MYDDELNVKEIYSNNVLISKYEYDNYNELINEKNYNTDLEIIYTYDTSGNLVSRIYKNMNTNNTLSTDLFTYSNTNWEDQLTSYNNNAITYDAIGNMISYKNSAYTWVNGNELSSITNINTNQSVNYQYNDQGIRTSKTINGVTTNYINLNDDIVFEDRNGTIIYYLYDCDGIIGMKYNGDNYYYIKDSQNNIVGLLDESGNRIVSYSYDSWGNILYIKDENNIDISDNANHIGIINPFRYKSYYYDSESGLYYLKHRYYNPEISRFISPDIILGANKDILSYNQYAYAGNNPISKYDSSGQNAVTKILVTMLVAIVSKVVKTVKKINNKNVKKPVVTGIFHKINPDEINFPINATYGYGSNLKMESSLNSKTTSITSNTYGTSAEYRYGDLGYDVDPNSFNFFSSTTIDIATTKTTYGVDGDYFFFGYDEEIDYDETGSLSAFVRVNIRKEIVYGAVIAAYVTLAIAALKDIVVQVAKTIVVTSPSWVPHMDEVYQYVKEMT